MLNDLTPLSNVNPLLGTIEFPSGESHGLYPKDSATNFIGSFGSVGLISPGTHGTMTTAFPNGVLSCSFGKIKYHITGFSILIIEMTDHTSDRERAFLSESYDYWSFLKADLSAL